MGRYFTGKGRHGAGKGRYFVGKGRHFVGKGRHGAGAVPFRNCRGKTLIIYCLLPRELFSYRVYTILFCCAELNSSAFITLSISSKVNLAINKLSPLSLYRSPDNRMILKQISKGENHYLKKQQPS